MNDATNDVKRSATIVEEVFDDLKIKGISMDQAAERLGYKSTQTLYNIRSSQSEFKREQAYRFAEAFGYNPHYLLERKGQLMTSPLVQRRKFAELRYVALIEIATNIIKHCGNAAAVGAWKAINNGDLEKYQNEIRSLIGRDLMPGEDNMILAGIASQTDFHAFLKEYGAPMELNNLSYMLGKSSDEDDK